VIKDKIGGEIKLDLADLVFENDKDKYSSFLKSVVNFNRKNTY